jgi:AGCS family alanine or glycine:cation symporter
MEAGYHSLVAPLTEFLWTYVLVFVLIGAGVYFSVATRLVQIRHFPTMLSTLFGSRSGAGEGLSSFQAFVIGLSSRVGTGNIAGVAIAMTLGGPGAVFWMWVVALLGMATAFVEATLAQVFKIPGPQRTFIGGPAYYLQRGLGSRRWGLVFAAIFVFTFAVAFSMVQANTIADVVGATGWVTREAIAIGLVVCLAPVLFGGLKRVARFAEVVVPAMAVLYIALALLVVVLNIGRFGGALRTIVSSAFGLNQTLAGLAGGFAAAVLNGAKRGLFSNEAGMGSAPNTAATATTPHPVNQGFVQSFGVFVDTMLVCTATAFIVLLGGIYIPGKTGEAAGATLTIDSMKNQLGPWIAPVMTVLVFAFAFTSLLGNYAYAEVNVDFLGGRRRGRHALRVVMLAAAVVGALIALQAVWLFADLAMGIMALINLVALFRLARWATGALRDWERQHKLGVSPAFDPTSADLPRPLEGDAWRPGATSAPAPAAQGRVVKPKEGRGGRLGARLGQLLHRT